MDSITGYGHGIRERVIQEAETIPVAVAGYIRQMEGRAIFISGEPLATLAVFANHIDH